MAGLTDFLFGGQAPPNVTSTGTSTTSLPQWMQDYGQSIVARSALQGMEGYQSYAGPRVAGLNDDQLKAIQNVRDIPSTYGDVMDTSKTALTNASKTLPDSINSYLNPYTENVTDRSRDLALRNWNEDIMPGISDIFVRNGTYASSNMADKLLQGGRDVSEGLQDQYKANLSDAYTSAANEFGSDASRSLQTAQTGGNLAQLTQNLGLSSASALAGAGQQEQDQTQKNYDTAYQDFQNQTQYPWEQLQKESAVLQGMPYSSSTSTTGSAPLAGAQYGSSGLSSILAGISAGKGIWDLTQS